MRRFLAFCLLICLLLPALAACSKQEDSTTGTTTPPATTTTPPATTTTEPPATTTTEDPYVLKIPEYASNALFWEATVWSGSFAITADYRIIYASGISNLYLNNLKDAIQTATGHLLATDDDTVAVNDPENTITDKEILVGLISNRPESAAAMTYMTTYSDSVVGTFYIGVANRKLVIMGDNSASLGAAITFFSNQMLAQKAEYPIYNDLSSLYVFHRTTYAQTKTLVCYNEDELNAAAEVLKIYVDGQPLTEYDKETDTYNVELIYRPDYPLLGASIHSPLATLTLVQPTAENGGVGSVSVTSADGTVTHTYQVNIAIKPYFLGQVQLHQAKNGANGIISMVSDDGQWATAQHILLMNQEFGLRTNLALIADNFGTLLDEDGDGYYDVDEDGNYSFTLKESTTITNWKNLIANNPEYLQVTNHSYAHSSWGLDPKMVAGDLFGSQQIFQATFPGQRVLTYAYPGYTSTISGNRESEYAAAKALMPQTYVAARFLQMGKNNPIINPDYFRLNAASIPTNVAKSLWGTNGQNADGWLMQAINNSANNGGWVVNLYHHIGDVASGSMTMSKEYYRYVIENYIMPHINSGKLWSAFFDEAGRYVAEYNNATLDQKFYGDKSRIEITLTDTLDDALYDYPLTIDVTLPEDWGWDVVLLTHYDAEGESYEETCTILTADDGSHYVRLNLVPDRGVATLTTDTSGN